MAQSVSEFITDRTIELGLTLEQLTVGVGLEGREKLVSMILDGRAKLPVNHAAAFAIALQIDPAQLIEMVFKEYSPSTWQAIEEHLLKRSGS